MIEQTEGHEKVLLTVFGIVDAASLGFTECLVMKEKCVKIFGIGELAIL